MTICSAKLLQYFFFFLFAIRKICGIRLQTFPQQSLYHKAQMLTGLSHLLINMCSESFYKKKKKAKKVMQHRKRTEIQDSQIKAHIPQGYEESHKAMQYPGLNSTC